MIGKSPFILSVATMLATIISWTQAVPVPNAPAAAGTSTIWPNAIERGDPDRTHIGLPDRQPGPHKHDRPTSPLVEIANHYNGDLPIPRRKSEKSSGREKGCPSVL